jgi:hypothetical protein
VRHRARNGNCDISGAVFFRKRVSVRRRILDALLAAMSLTMLSLVILAIDARAGDQMARFVKTTVSANGGAAAQLHHGVSHAARSVSELSFVYGPLMTFTAVAFVLFVVLLRTK